MPIVTTLHTILAEPNPWQRAAMDELTQISERLVVMSEHGAKLLRDALTRWLGDEDGYIRVRWQRDVEAMRVILRVITGALEDRTAEADADIADDLTAMSYGRLFEWIRQVQGDMAQKVRESRRLGLRPKKAYDELLQHARNSLAEATA